MKRHLPLFALLLATQTGCSILSGNTVSVPIASNNGNNNGSQNGSYNNASASAGMPQSVDIGVARLPETPPVTSNGTPVILPASVSLNRVSTEIANLPRTSSGNVDLQSIYYGGEVNPAINMDAVAHAAAALQPQRTAAVTEDSGSPVYSGASGSR